MENYKYKEGLWLGLRRISSSTTYEWGWRDNVDVTFTNWYDDYGSYDVSSLPMS